MQPQRRTWLAAGGYFFFSYYFVARTDPDAVRIGHLCLAQPPDTNVWF